MDDNILLNSSKIIFEPHVFINKDIPFIYHNSTITGSDFANFHENLELLYFSEGDGWVSYDSKEYAVSAGDIVIINSFSAHKIYTNTALTRACLIIDNSFCKYHNIDISTISFSHIVRSKTLNDYFSELDKAFKSNEAFKSTKIKSIVLNILLSLCLEHITDNAPQNISKFSYNYIFSAIEYIKRNINKKISANEVAEYVGLSKYHFLREFKKYTGYTLINYINIIKCEYAKELLRSRSLPVKDIALQCGFDNFSYFTNVFKKYVGALPSDCRKE